MSSGLRTHPEGLEDPAATATTTMPRTSTAAATDEQHVDLAGAPRIGDVERPAGSERVDAVADPGRAVRPVGEVLGDAAAGRSDRRPNGARDLITDDDDAGAASTTRQPRLADEAATTATTSRPVSPRRAGVGGTTRASTPRSTTSGRRDAERPSATATRVGHGRPGDRTRDAHSPVSGGDAGCSGPSRTATTS
jgi:hypothetical protein